MPRVLVLDRRDAVLALGLDAGQPQFLAENVGEFFERDIHFEDVLAFLLAALAACPAAADGIALARPRPCRRRRSCRRSGTCGMSMSWTGMETRCLPSLPISSPRERNLRRSLRILPLTIWRKRWWSCSILLTIGRSVPRQ